HRQERVLLGAVEAMDLVDEQKRPLPSLASGTRRVKHLLEVGDARKDRGNLLEVEGSRPRQEPGDRGLAGAGRPPEAERPEGTGMGQARGRACRAEQMVLADDLAELARPQLVGERTRRIALEPGRREQASFPALGARRHPRSSTDICWPPRMMVMRQTRFCCPAMRCRSPVLAILVLLTVSTRSPR